MTSEKHNRRWLLFQKQRIRVTARGENLRPARRKSTDQCLDSWVKRIVDARRHPHRNPLQGTRVRDYIAAAESRPGREGSGVRGTGLRVRRPDGGTDCRDRRDQTRESFGDGERTIAAHRYSHQADFLRSDTEALALTEGDEFV